MIPYSGRWMWDFKQESEELVKNYCREIIDPLTLKKDSKIVLVDYSLTGDSIFQVTPIFLNFSVYIVIFLKNIIVQRAYESMYEAGILSTG